MDLLKFCILIGSIFASSESADQYYFVISPNVIRFNNPETVLVSIFGKQEDVTISVWLKHRDKTFSYKSVTVANEAKPVITTLRVTETDLFNTETDEKPRKIQLCSRQYDHSTCKDIVISYQTGYLIVQTDKPIYTPRQKVKIRALALDESLKTVSGDKWAIYMDIVSPSNITLGRRVFPKTTSTGFYDNAFDLPPDPEIGIWTARAFYGGKYETVSRALFQVEEYVLPIFDVTVKASRQYILSSDSDETGIDFTVNAMYVYGKPVAGKVRLSMNVTDEGGNSIYIMDLKRKELQNGVGEFSIRTEDILKSQALKDKVFPEGSRLDVVAAVFESATGKEESALYDAIVFAKEPYIFKFTKSRRYFRPGMKYFFKVDVFTPNNVPVPNATIHVRELDDTEDKIVKTDSRGQALAIFQTQQQKKQLSLRVNADGSSLSHTFEALAYDDENQVQVERIITGNNVMMMTASSNMQLGNTGSSGSSYTGMLFVIVSRGKIVHAVFKQASNNAGEKIEEAMQEIINPAARLLVFYVDEKSNRLVADSIKMEVDAKCRGKGLSLNPSLTTVLPGQQDKLTITGTPESWVGLNAMDKDLLLLNDKNILTKNKMFDALRSHDLGCGEGSGKNNGDIFKNAGLFVMSNAWVSNDLYRSSEECDPKTRRKRSADDCFGAHINCCVYGKWYADEVFNKTDKEDEKAKLDSYTLCYTAAKKAFDTKRSPNVNCTMAILHTCIDRMDFLISNLTQIVSTSLNDVSHYESDLKRLAEQRIRPHKRTDFRESFLFEVVQLDRDGETEEVISYPDSITEWRIQAIGITENHGMCIADPVDVKVFRDYFIQLDLPYKATRFELFDVKVTLFSYGTKGDPEKQVNLYLEGVNGLCYGTKSGQPSPKMQLNLGPNTASTVHFPVIPLKAGIFDVKVIAIVTNLKIPEVIVEKPLFVANEGIQETMTIQVCLDPNKKKGVCQDHERVKTQYFKQPGTGISEQLSTIDLALPSIAIQGTGSATAYFQGNVMNNVVRTILSGVSNLFTVPSGGSEQTISSTTPNVYAMMYLKQTKQVTGDIETVGNANIRNGVNRELSMYRNPDGSYKCYRSGTEACTSVWLTAFVAKVFCHANSVVDGLLDETTDLYPTITYLKNRINEAGQFKEIHDIYSGFPLKGVTENGNTPSLTAFVLISLLECNVMQASLNRTVDLATHYLETLDEQSLKDSPFDLAITTYALALAESKKKLNFKNWLDSIKTSSGKNIYWIQPGGNEGNSYSIETTAYALLAMLKFNDLQTAASIVRWLTSHQNARGAFISTQDTAISLQALSEYSIKSYSPEVDLKVSLTAQKWQQRQISVNNVKDQREQIVDKLPVEIGDSTLTLLVTGTSGAGRMRIELRYNRPARDDKMCPFDLSEIDVGDVYKLPTDRNIRSLGKCDVCGHCAADSSNPNYNLLTTPAPANVTTESNVGRGKRHTTLSLVDNMKCIRFKVSAKPGQQYGMSMVYFNLETDVTVIQEDMEKVMNDNDNLDYYEMPKDHTGSVVFFLKTLTSVENEFVFRLVDNPADEASKHTRQPVSVDVFDYYDPDKYCRKMYSTDPNKGADVEYKCDSEKEQCKCLENTCAFSLEKQILKDLKSRKTPAVELGRYTCNPDKADYADIVKVKSVSDDNGNKKAIAEIKYPIHRGGLHHKKGDEYAFFWKATCPFPKLDTNTWYLIIGKDGYRAKNNSGNDEYQYSLMDTAVVLDLNSSGLLRVIRNYMSWMKRNEQRCGNK